MSDEETVAAFLATLTPAQRARVQSEADLIPYFYIDGKGRRCLVAAAFDVVWDPEARRGFRFRDEPPDYLGMMRASHAWNRLVKAKGRQGATAWARAQV